MIISVIIIATIKTRIITKAIVIIITITIAIANLKYFIPVEVMFISFVLIHIFFNAI